MGLQCQCLCLQRNVLTRYPVNTVRLHLLALCLNYNIQILSVNTILDYFKLIFELINFFFLNGHELAQVYISSLGQIY